MRKQIRIAGGPDEYRIWVDGHEIANAVSDLQIDMSAEKPTPDHINLTLFGEFVFGEPENGSIDMSGFGELEGGPIDMSGLRKGLVPTEAYYDPVKDAYYIDLGGTYGSVLVPGELLMRHDMGIDE